MVLESNFKEIKESKMDKVIYAFLHFMYIYILLEIPHLLINKCNKKLWANIKHKN